MSSIVSAAASLPLAIPTTSLGIVVARYKEDLEPWLSAANYSYIYDKGGIPQSNDTVNHDAFRSYVELPNIGREGHTHLYHIVNNWNTLEDYMIFSQADPYDLIGTVVNSTNQMIDVALQVKPNEVNPFDPTLFHDVDDWAKINWTDPKESIWITASQLSSLVFAPYTPEELWNYVLREDHPPAIRAAHGGTFAVRRETIYSQPLEAYERALQRFTEANTTNPEVGFMWERFWTATFSNQYWLQAVENP
ncbi:uncharacterized protein TRIVIDRAFT_66318 [Trichoderma virens Gv29-8]|uniref:Uncharacterized protein n=1 Tax=Hypocrea virens (strain Gv29-8 / FGSC 10586) TaxID=413071 RepID=G9N7D6_HYPVG|nr:uncharacterized protein TRIVIDRAFT_66318 [Trichoderma virens Gv29-8]EHK17387.1 hypothetical protein TRIVIDRAFT_66318 [Trichoderma virens Gv29-8]UKZ55805.1 hypothetical protein TrVGV298_009629 [Trichoderma virens]